MPIPFFGRNHSITEKKVQKTSPSVNVTSTIDSVTETESREIRTLRTHLRSMEGFYTAWLKDIPSRSDKELEKIAADKDNYFQKKQDNFMKLIQEDEGRTKNIEMLSGRKSVVAEMEDIIQQEKNVYAMIEDGRRAAKQEMARRESGLRLDEMQNQLKEFEKHLQEMEAFILLWFNDLSSKSDEHLRQIVVNKEGNFYSQQKALVQTMCDDEIILRETRENFRKFSDMVINEDEKVFWNNLIEKMQDVFRQLQQRSAFIEGGYWQAKQELDRRKEQKEKEKQALRMEKAQKVQEAFEQLKKETEVFRAKWLHRGNETRIVQFERDKEELKAEIADGKKKLKQYQTELDRNAQKQYRQDIRKIQQTYQGADKLYDQMNEEYKFFTKQLGICDQYEKTFIPQFNELLTQVDACVAEDQKDKWRQKDDEIEAQVKKLRAIYDGIAVKMKMCSMEIPAASKKQTYYFLQDMRELEARQKNLKNTCESIMEQIRTTLKALEEQNVVDESHVPEYDPASGEVVYLEYDRKVKKTIIKRNGEDILSNSQLYRVENMSIEEWFTEDKNWEGLPIEIKEEINDPFIVQFCGSKAEYKMVEDAFAKADLDGLEYKIKWFKK